MPKESIKIDIPKALSDKILQTMEMAKNTGKVRKGMNETTKAVERGIAQLVVIANDVEPEEIVMHLPVLCEEKNIPYVYVPSKQELGRSVGINVATAAACIVEPGSGKENLAEIIEGIKNLKKE